MTLTEKKREKSSQNLKNQVEQRNALLMKVAVGKL